MMGSVKWAVQWSCFPLQQPGAVQVSQVQA
jgi:hypothetical protein